jgi:hypothetical protein
MITNKFENFLLTEDLFFLENLPEVAIEKNRLKNNNKIYFSVTLPNSVKHSLSEKFGLDLSNITKIPMTWIKGDTPHHIDVGSSSFKNTYLVYLNDSPGEFIVNDNSYSITKNTAYVFSEGLAHKTINTGIEPRLLLGPMNEFAHPVGGFTIRYYTNLNDAIDNFNPNYIATQTTNHILGDPSYITGNITPYTRWKIGSVADGDVTPTTNTYTNGTNLGTIQFNFFGNPYFLSSNTHVTVYPDTNIPCFLEGSKILSLVDGTETYLPIEQIKPGTYVKTILNGYRKVELIGKFEMYNSVNNERTQDKIYKCSVDKYPELKEDLYITGCHSILVDELTDLQRDKTIKEVFKIFVTEKKYRLLACIDERAEPWESEGKHMIYHFALENDDLKMNYGVYANGGLLVETCSINYMKTKSNMQLIS